MKHAIAKFQVGEVTGGSPRGPGKPGPKRAIAYFPGLLDELPIGTKLYAVPDDTVLQQDHVILVAAGGHRCYLAQQPDEHGGEVRAGPPTTADPELAIRFQSLTEAMAHLGDAMKRYPEHQFRVDAEDRRGDVAIPVKDQT